MTVRVAFTRRRTLGSLLLRTFLWSAWSHCAILAGDTAIEASTAGVRERPSADLLGDASEYAIVELPGDEAAVAQWMRTQLGKPYDWWGVLGIGLRRRWQADDHWFCSELVAWAFDRAGYPLVRVQSWRITPRDLYLPLWR